MTKELIISIIIVVLIFVGNAVTENYTGESVDETKQSLSDLREEIIKNEDEIDVNIAKEKIDKIHEQWDSKYEKLAYYIEHDELEKVDTAIVQVRSFVENDDIPSAIAELETGKFVLEHIERKYKFNLQNIF